MAEDITNNLENTENTENPENVGSTGSSENTEHISNTDKSDTPDNSDSKPEVVVKKKRSKRKYFVIFLIILGLVFVGLYYWLNPKKALKFAIPNLNELSYVNAKIKSDTAYIEVIGVLENEAPYKITIDSLVYSLELAGVTLIAEKQELALRQDPGSIDTVTLMFRVPISKTRGLIKKLQGTDSTQITIHAEITYNTFFGITKFPFSKDFDIEVPTPPEISLNEIKAGELNLKQKNIDIELSVNIKNNSDKIELKLRDLVYDATLGEHVVGHGKYSKLLVIKPSSSINITLPINVTYDEPLRVLWKIFVKKDKMDYVINLEGTLQNEKMEDIPLSITAIGRTKLGK